MYKTYPEYWNSNLLQQFEKKDIFYCHVIIVLFFSITKNNLSHKIILIMGLDE
jgi:hypothetical protein